MYTGIPRCARDVKKKLLVISAALFLIAPWAFARDTGFLNRSVTVAGVTYRYQVYVPVEWTNKQKWPVILSLHGIGERGDDGIFSTELGLSRAIRRKAGAFPFVAVFPQCRGNALWVDKEMQEMAMAALDQTIKEFNGDRDRLILTGLSMGGFGVWEMAMRYAGTWAAIAPVCGALKAPPAYPDLHSHIVDLSGPDPYTEAAKKVGAVPAWLFHGTRDATIPVEESRKMVEAMKAVGAQVRYTEYPDMGHNAWDRAYVEPEFPKWVQEQRRKH